MSVVPRLRGVLVAAVASALVAGCSFALDFDDECERDLDCEAVDRAYRCDDGFCVEKDLVQAPSDNPAVVRPCTRLFGADPRTSVEPTILIGTILPRSGELATFGPDMERAIELAVEEINQSGGVSGTKLGVLACDSGTSASVAVAAARHLVDVGDVDAIIGAAASSITIEVFNSVVRDAGALLISSASTSPAITDLADEGRLWRTVPSDAIQGRAIARYIEDKGYDTVAVINRDDAYGNGLAAAIQENLCATRQCNADTYINRIYPASAEDPTQGDRQFAILTELAGRPATDTEPEIPGWDADVVVLISFVPDGVAFLNAAVGAPWDIVLTDGMKDSALLDEQLPEPDPAEQGINDPSVLCRIVGTNPASPSSVEFLAFQSKFTGRFGSPPGTYTANSYDALYLIGFAYAAARGAGHTAVDAVDGRALAEGLTRLSAATPVTVGSSEWNKGVSPLLSGPLTMIDVTGASGPLDFDPAVGEAPSGIEMWRVDLGGLALVNLPTILLEPDGTYHTPDLPPDPCATTR